jgi:nucleotide-binding universal stress UspA family protein
MKNILVAVDFDERTFELVNYAAEFAKKFGAKIWIVHIAAPEPDFVGYDVGPTYIRDSRAGELRVEHKNLRVLVDKLLQEGIEADALLISGSTVKMILDEAKKLHADLIITGSHDHSFIYNAFVGSTSLELFKKSEIPLLTVPLDKIKERLN